MRVLFLAVSAVTATMLMGLPEADAFTIEGPSTNGNYGRSTPLIDPRGYDGLRDSDTPGDTGTEPSYSAGPRRSDRLYGEPPRRMDLPAYTHPDDHHLFWGNSRYR